MKIFAHKFLALRTQSMHIRQLTCNRELVIVGEKFIIVAPIIA